MKVRWVICVALGRPVMPEEKKIATVVPLESMRGKERPGAVP